MWLFWDMLHSTKSKIFSYIYCYFIIDKRFRGPDVMALRAGIGLWVVVWRPLGLTEYLLIYRKTYIPMCLQIEWKFFVTQLHGVLFLLLNFFVYWKACIVQISQFFTT